MKGPANRPRHPLVASYSTNQGNVLLELGRAAEALPLFERALAIQLQRQGPEHCNTLDTQVSRGLARVRSGVADQLVDLERLLAAELRLACPPEYVAAAQSVLAEAARREGAFERAVTEAKALEARLVAEPSLVRHGFTPGLELAMDSSRRGRHDEALGLANAACARLAPVLPATHPSRVECAVETVRLTLVAGRAVGSVLRAAALEGDDAELAPPEVAVRVELRKVK